jgi:hypothetical protein
MTGAMSTLNFPSVSGRAGCDPRVAAVQRSEAGLVIVARYRAMGREATEPWGEFRRNGTMHEAFGVSSRSRISSFP